MSDVASQESLAKAGAEGADFRRAGAAVDSGHAAGAPLERRWWRDALRRRLLASADLAAAAVAAAVAAVPATHSGWAFAFLPLWLLVAKLLGLYDRDHRVLRHLTADEIPAIFAWAGISTAFLALLLPLTSAGTLGGFPAAVHFVVAALAAIGFRALARWAWWKRTPPELVGMIGDADALASMRRKFKLFGDMHFELAAELMIDQIGAGEPREIELRALTDSVDRIVLAADGVAVELIAELNVLCRERQVKLSVVSPLRGRALPSSQISQLADLPIFEYSTWDPSRTSLLIKRLSDLVIATVGLLLTLPLFPFVALAIRLDSPGPVLFSQIRAGIGGRPFRMFKLRTMWVDAEARLDEVVNIRVLDEPVFKLRNDPRVTRVGRVLRRLSLDELPQLVNVLVGEMSIVGPRPEQVELVERYSPEHRLRLTVKPGITGPMQVFGRGELTFSERLAVELEYVDNPSLASDLRILLHTVPAIVRGTGAF